MVLTPLRRFAAAASLVAVVLMVHPAAQSLIPSGALTAGEWVNDWMADAGPSVDDYIDLMIDLNTLLAQWELALVSKALGITVGSKDDVIEIHGDSTTPPEPPKPSEPPVNKDVIPIHGDGTSQPVDVVPTSSLQPLSTSVNGFTALRLVDWRQPGPAASPVAVFRALGDGTFEMRVVGGRALSAREGRLLSSGDVALLPLAPEVGRQIDAYVSSMVARGGVSVARMRLRSYCLASEKKAAAAGVYFLPVPRRDQPRFAGVPAIRFAAESAAARGYLKPQGEPAAYGRFIAQYAIWTALEGWDEARFTREFVARSRQAADAVHRPWTKETEKTLRVMAPSRWRDVQNVLAGAARLEQRRRARVAGGAE